MLTSGWPELIWIKSDKCTKSKDGESYARLGRRANQINHYDHAGPARTVTTHSNDKLPSFQSQSILWSIMRGCPYSKNIIYSLYLRIILVVGLSCSIPVVPRPRLWSIASGDESLSKDLLRLLCKDLLIGRQQIKQWSMHEGRDQEITD
jgi:hypothetical protein